jgi:tellurite methyltransferase
MIAMSNANKPFWEKAYQDDSVSAFSKGPTVDVGEYWSQFPPNSRVLDVGCGEGRNAIFLAEKGFAVEAFDLSEAGIEKAKRIAEAKGISVRFFVCNLGDYRFEQDFDVILSHGVLHLCEREIRNKFIEAAKLHTATGGVNAIGIFTNRLPAAPDMAAVTKSLFDVGELPAFYDDWDLIHHHEGTFSDEHPGGIKHHHAYERMIARKSDPR